MKIENGDRFGRLTVIRRTGSINYGKGHSYKKYLCMCICGKEKEVPGYLLTSGRVKSCGCLSADHAKAMNKTTCDQGTNIAYLKKRTIRSNNKSGVAGVYKLPSGHWAAYITLRGIRYYLGQYSTLDEAARQRKEAEEKLFDEFLEWYENKKSPTPN